MESRTKAIVSFAVLIVLLIGLYFFTQWFSLFTGYVLGEDEKIRLTQCLDGKGSILYISETCPECEVQMEIFGDTALQFLDIKTCESLEGECAELNGFPSWKINGKNYLGFKDFNELIEISGCSLDQ